MTERWKKIAKNWGVAERTGRARNERLQAAADLATLHEHRRQLLASPRYADELRLLKHGYRVYSQADEDGILHEIFRRIGTGERTFVELGTGDGSENNSLFLLMQGWRGLWIEGSARKVAAAREATAGFTPPGRLCIEQHFVTSSNIDARIAELAPAKEIDLLSIDLDGNDYYVLEAIQSVKPRVIVAEYNAKFPADFPWVMEYNEGHRWGSTDYFGTSLKALEILLSKRGYALVGCSLLGVNSFFVRQDLIGEGLFCNPFTAENHFEPQRYFLLSAFESGFPADFGPFRVIS